MQSSFRPRAMLALAATCLVALTGATWETRLPQPRTTQTPVYTIVDVRPDSVKKNDITVQGCAEGAYRVGERYFDPSLTTLLHAMLIERFGDRLAGKTVTVRGFTVHINSRVADEAMAKRSLTPLGYDLSQIGKKDRDKCANADLFGSYVDGEVPAGVTPLIVAAAVQIDGKIFMGRAIAPSPSQWPASPKSTQAQKDTWNAAVTALVDQALAQLGDKIEAGLFASAAATPGTAP